MKCRIISIMLEMRLASYKKYILVAIIVLLASFHAQAKVYLLSVGIADYPGEKMDLMTTERDARSIAWLYSLLPENVCHTLLGKEATKDNIISAIKNTFTQADSSDIVLFYYSGHGNPGGFFTYDSQLQFIDVRKAMSASKCKNKIIFADACYSGKIRTEKQPVPTTGAQTQKYNNVMMFLSSRSNEVSLESTGFEHSIFTNFLYKGLRGLADYNNDKTITAKELFLYVHKQVVDTTKDKQHPVMWGNFSDNMPVIIWK